MEQEQAVLEGEQGEVVESQNTEVTTEVTSEQVESAPTEDAKPEVDNTQKRINKITAEKYGEKRRADALQDEVNQLKAGSTQNEVAPSEGAPTLEQFDFDESKFQTAFIRHEVEQGMKAQRDEDQKARSNQAQIQLESDFNDKEVKYATDNPDYVDDVNNLPRFTPETLSIIKGQDNAPNLVHYLSKNPEIAHTIASLDPRSAGVQIGMVLAKLSATNKPAVTPSTAADPIEPISSGGDLSSDDDKNGVTYE